MGWFRGSRRCLVSRFGAAEGMGAREKESKRWSDHCGMFTAICKKDNVSVLGLFFPCLLDS